MWRIQWYMPEHKTWYAGQWRYKADYAIVSRTFHDYFSRFFIEWE